MLQALHSETKRPFPDIVCLRSDILGSILMFLPLALPKNKEADFGTLPIMALELFYMFMCSFNSVRTTPFLYLRFHVLDACV